MLTLRPFQKEALSLLAEHSEKPRHLLCVAPTGSGKSLIYEKLASQPGRKTLLISPLIALARQQAQRLEKSNVPTFLSAGDSKKFPSANQSGIWILSPELLQFEKTKNLLKLWKPDLLVVDECHCLWDWGETFRPAFQLIPPLLRLPTLKKSLWLTATLPQEARAQLRSILSPHLVELGKFQLPESIFLELKRNPLTQRLKDLIHWTLATPQPGIVFMSTRESTLRLADEIKKAGKEPIIYHAGLAHEERLSADTESAKRQTKSSLQPQPLGWESNYPQLSYAILWQAPLSLLSFVQGIGRVGRNQKTLNHARIYWDYDDFRLLEWLTKSSEKHHGELKQVLHFLRSEECRRGYLENHFNQTTKNHHCGVCDYCIKIAHRIDISRLNLPIGRWLKNC